MQHKPIYTVHSSAPTRICDNGGWTDTWFAKYGQIFNIAIEPRVDVEITVYNNQDRAHRVVIVTENFDEQYVRELGTPWQKHPLIEAAVDMCGIPDDRSVEIRLFSDAPPGASMGTSAALVVALIGALDCLTEGRLAAHEVAYAAQKVETDMLGGQCGIQDQLAAAYGGISFIDMFQYPMASVSPIRPKKEILWELERRLLVVYMGKPHQSSLVHEEVIHHLEGAGAEEPRLDRLRKTAAPARDTLLAGDFFALGKTFIENTDAQKALHSGLINPAVENIIQLAKSHGTLGWKVNGAGGEGGSLALLLGQDRGSSNVLVKQIEQIDRCEVIRPRLASEGLRRYVWQESDS